MRWAGLFWAMAALLSFLATHVAREPKSLEAHNPAFEFVEIDNDNRRLKLEFPPGGSVGHEHCRWRYRWFGNGLEHSYEFLFASAGTTDYINVAESFGSAVRFEVQVYEETTAGCRIVDTSHAERTHNFPIPPTPTPEPSIVTFAISPSTLPVGNRTTFSWSVLDTARTELRRVSDEPSILIRSTTGTSSGCSATPGMPRNYACSYSTALNQIGTFEYQVRAFGTGDTTPSATSVIRTVEVTSTAVATDTHTHTYTHTPTRTDTPTRTNTPRPDQPTAPRPGSLSVVCNRSGAAIEAVATWQRPSNIPSTLTFTGYEYRWVFIVEGEEEFTEGTLGTEIVRLTNDDYLPGDRPVFRLVAVYDWPAGGIEVSASSTATAPSDCELRPGETPGDTLGPTDTPDGIDPPDETDAGFSRTPFPCTAAGINIRVQEVTTKSATLLFNMPITSGNRLRVGWSLPNNRWHPAFRRIEATTPFVFRDNMVTLHGLEDGTRYTVRFTRSIRITFAGGFVPDTCVQEVNITTDDFVMNVDGPSVIRYLDVNSAQYRVTNMSDASEASLAYGVGAREDRPGEGYATYGRYSGPNFRDEVNDVTQGLMGFRGVLGNRCRRSEFYSRANFTPFISSLHTNYTFNVCANRPGLDNIVTIQIFLQGRLGSNTQYVALGSGSIRVSLVGQDPAATSLPPTGDCNDSYYRMSWRMGGATDFVHYTVVYTIGNLSSRSVTVAGRSTTSYMVTGVAGANVGDSINWRVSSAHLFIDDDDNEQGSSFPVGNGTGTMQACPSGPPTDTFTPTHTVSPTACQPPRNMTFNRYADSTRFIYFDFDAPLSGGPTRLHYQPQYRRLPSTGWTNTSFTVAANRTEWSVRFTNESFTAGRTIEFRLVSVCTGNAESVPSNVVSYTYPGSTPTNTNTPSGATATNTNTPTPTPTHTPTPTTTSDCRSATNFRRSSTSSDGFDVTYAWTRSIFGETISGFRREWRETTDNPNAAWVSAEVFPATTSSFSVPAGPSLASRTFQNRIITICGSNTSAPSNHTTYTYPEAEDSTPTPTRSPTNTSLPTETPTNTSPPLPPQGPCPTPGAYVRINLGGGTVSGNWDIIDAPNIGVEYSFRINNGPWSDSETAAANFRLAFYDFPNPVVGDSVSFRVRLLCSATSRSPYSIATDTLIAPTPVSECPPPSNAIFSTFTNTQIIGAWTSPPLAPFVDLFGDNFQDPDRDTFSVLDFYNLRYKTRNIDELSISIQQPNFPNWTEENEATLTPGTGSYRFDVPSEVSTLGAVIRFTLTGTNTSTGESDTDTYTLTVTK